jgi:hypothetical protein
VGTVARRRHRKGGAEVSTKYDLDTFFNDL